MRNVLITGGSSGIGRACVRRFAEAGDCVWFTYRRGRDRAEALVAELSETGTQCGAFEFDQGDWASHEQLLDLLPGPVEVLVNNAAVGSATVADHVPGAEHERAAAFLQINSVGPLWLIQRLLPGMLERGFGKVVNIGSVGGGVAVFPGFHVADGMSKAALAYLTRHLAAELVHTPVDMFAVNPGAVETNMLEASTLSHLSPDERTALAARLPKGRLLQPEEIASLVWWLTGEHAAPLHGAVLDASMGLGVRPGLIDQNSTASVEAFMTSRAAKLLAADVPVIAAAHFEAEADRYGPDNPGGYVNLGTADNRLVWDLLAPRLSVPVRRDDVHYGLLYGTPELRAAIAAALGPVWPGVDPEDLVVVSGATAALDVLATALCDLGEAIMVPAPYYAAFDTDLTARSGAVLVPAPMSPATGFALDPAVLDRALTTARRDGVVVRALAVTSPGNPVGQVHPAAVLRDVLDVAAAHSVEVIADEIYAYSAFGAEFTSMVGADGVHGIWGLAKDFGLSGFKVGVLHTRDPDVRAAARALAYFAPVSTHTQALVAGLLSDTAWVGEFLAENRRRLGESATATTKLLAAGGIGYVEPAGGFSLWVDLRPHLPEPTAAGEHVLWQRILRSGRVNILPGTAFACAEPGWFRLCHATDASTVATGVTRLVEVLAA